VGSNLLGADYPSSYVESLGRNRKDLASSGTANAAFLPPRFLIPVFSSVEPFRRLDCWPLRVHLQLFAISRFPIAQVGFPDYVRRLQRPAQFGFVRKAYPHTHHPFLKSVPGSITILPCTPGYCFPGLGKSRVGFSAAFPFHRLASPSDAGATTACVRSLFPPGLDLRRFVAPAFFLTARFFFLACSSS
jgi:hypothetical protein